MLKTSVPKNFKHRRESLMALDPEACFVFFGSNEVIRNNDSHFPFRQNANFFYLTEYDEPGAILVLVAGKSHLFVLERDLNRELWDGERYGVERAKSVFQVEHSYLVTEFYSKFDELLTHANKVFYTLADETVPNFAARDQRVLTAIHHASRFRGKGSFGHLPVHDPMTMLAQLRVIKDEYELTQIRKACSISARAHVQIMKRVKVGMTEFEAQAEWQYFAFKNGCTELGYTPIFASGANATTLHYNRNNETLKHGDLLLVDAGAEIGNYTADITQTFPLSSKFSPEQRKIYEKVLEVNREITRMIKPGVTYRALHTKSTEMATEALLSLGVLTGSVQENLETHTYRKYYPHGLGHYLGLDVHDAGLYSERGVDFELKAGMILTNEPGLYFRDGGSPYSGIGVRIEDDILITEKGADVLTWELPRDIDTIENLRGTANS